MAQRKDGTVDERRQNTLPLTCHNVVVAQSSARKNSAFPRRQRPANVTAKLRIVARAAPAARNEDKNMIEKEALLESGSCIGLTVPVLSVDFATRRMFPFFLFFFALWRPIVGIGLPGSTVLRPTPATWPLALTASPLEVEGRALKSTFSSAL